ncbi:MAG: hypothetical protein HFH25_06210 [Lachnospiraceae bacterium]|nr:hypothetical protein [Lachnospiraceae bacterium]
MRSQRKGERPAGKRRRQALQLFAAAALLVGYALSLEGDRGPGSKEYPALEWIRAQEQADVGAVEQELAEREQAEIAAREAEQNPETEEKPMDRQSLRQRFGLAVLVGDSVAEGFLDYEFLEASSVIARKGLRADTAGEEIGKALDLSPTCLFLSMGLNDLEYCRGDSGRFVEYYRERIVEIRESHPDLPVYVCGILPILPGAVEKKAELGYVDAFNEALRQMCEEFQLPFIEGGDLLEGREEWYQKDEIHLKSEFYPLWLGRMEEVAGL